MSRPLPSSSPHPILCSTMWMVAQYEGTTSFWSSASQQLLGVHLDISCNVMSAVSRGCRCSRERMALLRLLYCLPLKMLKNAEPHFEQSPDAREFRQTRKKCVKPMISIHSGNRFNLIDSPNKITSGDITRGTRRNLGLLILCYTRHCIPMMLRNETESSVMASHKKIISFISGLLQADILGLCYHTLKFLFMCCNFYNM